MAKIYCVFSGDDSKGAQRVGLRGMQNLVPQDNIMLLTENKDVFSAEVIATVSAGSVIEDLRLLSVCQIKLRQRPGEKLLFTMGKKDAVASIKAVSDGSEHLTFAGVSLSPVSENLRCLHGWQREFQKDYTSSDVALGLSWYVGCRLSIINAVTHGLACSSSYIGEYQLIKGLMPDSTKLVSNPDTDVDRVLDASTRADGAEPKALFAPEKRMDQIQSSLLSYA